MKMLLSRWNRLLLGLIFFSIYTAFGAEKAQVFTVRLHEAISLGTFEYLKRVIEEARQDKAPVVLIELDTPGGFLEATRDIVQLFLNHDDPKIVVWVNPEGARAASAGSMITMAAHFAVMAPSTSIGAATPVSGQGEDIGKDLKKKVENDTIAFVRGIAEKRGRDAAWAEKSVSEAASLTSRQALEKKVIDAVLGTREEIWKALRERFPELPSEVVFLDKDKNLMEKTLGFLSNPNVAYALLSFGALCIYVEITNPGLIIPGALGALSLAVGAITMKIVPIRPGAVGLLILGLILLAIEILTALPTYGIAGIAGVASLFLSGLFLLDPSQTNLSLSPGLWLPIFFVVVFFLGLLGWASLKALRNGAYRQGIGALTGKRVRVENVHTSQEAMVKIRGELWRARWKNPREGLVFLLGQELEVVGQEGLVLLVEEPGHEAATKV